MRIGCFLFSGVFWGTLLILLGISVILKAIFNINIPIFRIGFALLIIYFGLKILIGGCGVRTNCNTIVFNESEVKATKETNEYSIVFGRGLIDLSDVSAEKSSKMRVTTVFGKGTVKINPELPVRVFVDSVLGSARTPDGNAISSGKYIYKTKNFDENKKYIEIDATVVFGDLTIIDK